MASRILGMGDVLSIIEKAELEFSEEESRELEEKIRKMIPGMGNLQNLNVDDKEIVKIEAIIQSMTEKERQNHKILNGSRRKRIAMGSGTSVEQVNKFIKSFDLFKKVMKDIKNPKDLNKIMSKLKSGGYGKI